MITIAKCRFHFKSMFTYLAIFQIFMKNCITHFEIHLNIDKKKIYTCSHHILRDSVN